MDNNEYTYKITEANEEDPTASVIEKGNIKVEFTIADMLGEQAQLRKHIDQWTGQRDHELAKVKNIIQHHPFILKMSEQDLFTAHMYQEALAIVKTLDTKLPEMQEQLDESVKEMEQIKSTLGITPVLVPANVDWDKAVDDLVNEADDTENGPAN